METMKRSWVSPVSGVQRFVPQRYCADCGDYDDAFYAKCRDSSCLIFYDDGNWTSDACRGGCGQGHLFTENLETLRNGNCYLLLKVTTNTLYSNSNIDYYLNQGWIVKDGDNYRIPSGINGESDMVTTLKANNELVRGYYNPAALDNHWIVTDELQKIRPAQS